MLTYDPNKELPPFAPVPPLVPPFPPLPTEIGIESPGVTVTLLRQRKPPPPPPPAVRSNVPPPPPPPPTINTLTWKTPSGTTHNLDPGTVNSLVLLFPVLLPPFQPIRRELPSEGISKVKNVLETSTPSTYRFNELKYPSP
jgi:hypothetical protein